MLGLSLDPPDSTRAYVLEHALDFPVTTFPSPKLVQLYRADRIPLVILLDSGGTVLYSRLGAIETAAAIDSVLRAVRVEVDRATVVGEHPLDVSRGNAPAPAEPTTGGEE
ncbi:MAG: peroxiredoxin family protein [Gemmatimonadota bacterium]